MKRLVVLAILMALAVPAFAAVSVNEEGYLRATLALEKLIKERNALIDKRDSDMAVEDSKANGLKRTISDAAEVNIDAKETEIDSMQGTVNSYTATP